MVVTAVGNNIRNIMALVRREFLLTKIEGKITCDSDNGDGLHRLHLANGWTVEATIIKNSRCSVTNEYTTF